jgi:ABC-2 type transport system permease protein
MLFAIMYVVFIHFLRLGGDVPHFPVALLLGNVIWSFFSEATNMGMVSIVNRGDLLRKLNFPKEIIVLSSICGAAINFSINLVVVLIFSIFNGVQFSWTVIVALPLFIELFLLATGIAFLLSTLFVRFRDLSQIWEVIMQAGMYATPIIYSLTFVMNQSVLAAKIIMLNPMAQIIQDMRYFIIDKANLPVWQVINNKAIVLIPYLIPIIVFVIGINVFNKHSKKFAEIL